MNERDWYQEGVKAGETSERTKIEKLQKDAYDAHLLMTMQDGQIEKMKDCLLKIKELVITGSPIAELIETGLSI